MGETSTGMWSTETATETSTLVSSSKRSPPSPPPTPKSPSTDLTRTETTSSTATKRTLSTRQSFRKHPHGDGRSPTNNGPHSKPHTTKLTQTMTCSLCTKSPSSNSLLETSSSDKNNITIYLSYPT